MIRSARTIAPERQNIAKTLVKAGFPGKARFYESFVCPGSRLLGSSMMPHCRKGAMSVSQTNFHDHVAKGAGHFGTFFNVVLMAPPRSQSEDVRQVKRPLLEP
jgi:hypothetical protein